MTHTDLLTILTAAILIANTFHLTKLSAILRDAQAVLEAAPVPVSTASVKRPTDDSYVIK